MSTSFDSRECYMYIYMYVYQYFDLTGVDLKTGKEGLRFFLNGQLVSK